MDIIESVNLAVRFVVELGGLFALGFWGFQRGETERQRYAMASVAALSAAGLWALLVAPNAPVDPGSVIRVALQVLILGAAAVAIFAVGRPRLAVAFAIVAAVNGVLLYAFDQ